MVERKYIELAPMLKGKLKKQRSQIRENAIKTVASESIDGSRFTIKEIRSSLSSELGIEFSETTIVNVLANSDSFIQPDEDNPEVYELCTEVNIESYNSLLQGVWREFESEYSDQVTEYDRYSLDSNVKEAFEEFFDDLFNSIYQSTESLEDLNKDPLYSYSYNKIITEVTEDYDLTHPRQFRETLESYMNNPSEHLRELTEAIYIGLINRDLIDREKPIDFDEIPGRQKIIIFDTNVLVALLCETDSTHHVVKKMLDMSINMGFDIYYYSDTRNELRGLISGSKAEMKDFGGRPPSADAIDSQFVEDWFRKDTVSWDDYKRELSNWNRFLEMMSVKPYPDEIQCKISAKEFAKTSIKQLGRAGEGDLERSEDSLEHDSVIIGKTVAARESIDDSPGIKCPIIVTLDNLIAPISEMGEDELWDEHLIIQARKWLNYLLSYSSDELTEEDDIGSIILQTTVLSENSVGISSLDDYVDLVAPKANLDHADADMLKDYITTIGLKEEVEKSLREGKAGQAERQIREALTDEEYIEVFKEKSEKEEKLKTASETAQEFKERYEREKEKRKQIEKMVGDISGTEVNIDTTAIASSTGNEVAIEHSREFKEFVELLDTKLDGGLDGSDAPSPPDTVDNINQMREWLTSISTWLNTAENISPGAGSLAEYAETLASNLPV